jgi:hypothetical protein
MRKLVACVVVWGLGVAALGVVSCGKTNGLLPPPDGAAGVPPAATCTGTPVAATEAQSVDSVSEDVDATCESVAGFIDWKMGATGSACTGPSDCAPVCVPCPNGTHHSLASWCNHGDCAAPADVACMIAGTPSLASCS